MFNSIPKNEQPVKIKHIDGRTIDEIALENQRLKDQLKYNVECINNIKKLKKEEKNKETLKNLLTKNRKTFGFRIVMDGKPNADEQREIYEEIKKLIEKEKAKIRSIFILNNYLYLKTNINILFSVGTLSLPNGRMVEQINPRDILQKQNEY